MNLTPLEPTSDQLQNCVSWGWEYIGDGLFMKDDLMGYFTKYGFKRESV